MRLKITKGQLLTCCVLIACLAWPAMATAQEEQKVVELSKIKEAKALQEVKELEALKELQELDELQVVAELQELKELQKLDELQVVTELKALQELQQIDEQGLVTLKSKDGKVIMLSQTAKDKKGLLGAFGLGGKKKTEYLLEDGKFWVSEDGDSFTVKQGVGVDGQVVKILRAADDEALTTQINILKDGEVQILDGFELAEEDVLLTDFLQGAHVTTQDTGAGGKYVAQYLPPTQVDGAYNVFTQNYRQDTHPETAWVNAFSLFGSGAQFSDDERDFLENEFPLMFETLTKLEAEQDKSDLVFDRTWGGIAFAQNAAERKKMEDEHEEKMVEVRIALAEQSDELNIVMDELTQEIELTLKSDLAKGEKGKVDEEALAIIIEKVKDKVKVKEVEITELANEMEALSQEKAFSAENWAATVAPKLDYSFSMNQQNVRELQRIKAFTKDMMRLQAEDPEGYEIARDLENLEQQSQMLGQEIQGMKADDKERKVKTEELVKVLNQAFEVGEKRRQREADAVEDELNKIRELMAKRQENRDMIIKWRLGALTGQNGDIIW